MLRRTGRHFPNLNLENVDPFTALVKCYEGPAGKFHEVEYVEYLRIHFTTRVHQRDALSPDLIVMLFGP